MNCSYRGKKFKFECNFPMNVKIEGNNIIEGIKKLTDFGVAQAPLPPHLADLHSLAKNYFVIDDSAFN